MSSVVSLKGGVAVIPVRSHRGGIEVVAEPIAWTNRTLGDKLTPSAHLQLHLQLTFGDSLEIYGVQ